MSDDPLPPLTLRDFQRAERDAEYRTFLTSQYGIKDADLPPLVGGRPGRGIAERLGRGAVIAGSALNPFQDEIAGLAAGAGALMAPGLGVKDRLSRARSEYVTARDAAREPEQAFRREHPGASIAINLVGGVVSPLNRLAPVAATGKLAAATRLGRAGQGALAGAKGGAAFAFGAAEGDATQQALTTLGGGVLGGVVGAAGGALRDPRRGTEGAMLDDVTRQITEEGDNPLRVALDAVPTRTRRENLGRPGQAIALDVAAEGGAGGRAIVTAAEERVGRLEAISQRLHDTFKGGVDDIKLQERGELDASRTAIAGGLRSSQRGARAAAEEAADQAIGELAQVKRTAGLAEQTATEAAAGDRVADAFARHVGGPKHTLLQYEATAKRALQRVGRQVFGQLERRVGEIPPNEASAPIYEALGDPLVRATYRTRSGAPIDVEHLPTFSELQQTYIGLRELAQAAKANGGAVQIGGNAVHMRALYEAHDMLGQAMEKSIGGFKSANAAYRAQAATMEAFGDGYVSARAGQSADIADHLKALRRISPAAEKAYLTGLRRGTLDFLRELPSSQAAPEQIFAPGSNPLARLRIAFGGNEAGLRAFGRDLQRMSRDMDVPREALEEVRGVARSRLAGTRRELRSGVESTDDALTARGLAERNTIRDRAAGRVRGLRADLERDLADQIDPTELRDAKQIIAAGRAKRAVNPDSKLRKILSFLSLGLLRPAGAEISSAAGARASKMTPEVRALMAEFLEGKGDLRGLQSFQADATRARDAARRLGAGVGNALRFP